MSVFANIETEELRSLLPTSEDNRWEFKHVNKFDPLDKAELSKQVSAFSNSGGGILAYGIADDQTFHACPDFKGRQSMKDFLSAMVHRSVEALITHYSIHRVPITGTSGAIYLVEIFDSPVAPHQSIEDKIYYQRIDGHSKPANHFYLEMLRNRFKTPIVEIVQTRLIRYGDQYEVEAWVQNQSLIAALDWGLIIQTDDLTQYLTVPGGRIYYKQKARKTIPIAVLDPPYSKGYDPIKDEYTCVLTPFTSSSIGQPVEVRARPNEAIRI